MMESILSLKVLTSSSEYKKNHDVTGHFQEGLTWSKNHGGKPEKGCDLEPVEGSPSRTEDLTETENP